MSALIFDDHFTGALDVVFAGTDRVGTGVDELKPCVGLGALITRDVGLDIAPCFGAWVVEDQEQDFVLHLVELAQAPARQRVSIACGPVVFALMNDGDACCERGDDEDQHDVDRSLHSPTALFGLGRDHAVNRVRCRGEAPSATGTRR